tara:strand:+ start:184 stop:384 length:201 start_codon:yes stop_codon:yes gene_type:complete
MVIRTECLLWKKCSDDRFWLIADKAKPTLLVGFAILNPLIQDYELMDSIKFLKVIEISDISWPINQ